MFARLSRALYEVSRVTVGVLLVAILAIVLIQIVMRYGLSSSLQWSEEVVRMLLIWLTFLGASVALRTNDLVGLDILERVIGEGRMKAPHRIILSTLALIFVCFVGYYGYRLMMSPGIVRQSLSTVPISMAYVYASVPVSAALMAIQLVDNIISNIISRKHA